MSLRLLNKNRLRVWLIVFLVFTVLALMSFNRYVTNELAEGNPGRYRFYFIMETTGFYTVLFFVPLLIWFMKRFPIRKNNLATRVPLHVLTSMIFGVSHTMLMYVSRVVIFWIFNMGVYDYGRFEYRLLMEYGHQFLIYWTVYVVHLFIQSNREAQAQKIKTAELEQQLTEARLQALQMQVHPHFLFNTLNMISSTMFEDAKAADRMIANLSDLLRITLDSRGAEEHSLEKEMEILGLYVEIMRARFKKKLVVKTEIAPDTLDALVPGFLLQPLVENSIKFGMENLKSAKIRIVSNKRDGRLKLTIQDNGPGISEDPESVIQSGVGLSNTAERLEKLYGKVHRFSLRNVRGGGLRVEVEIPFRLSS